MAGLASQPTTTKLYTTLNNYKVLLYCPTYKVDGEPVIHPLTRESIYNLEFDGKLDIEINTVNRHNPPNYENVLEHYQRARERALLEGYDALFTVEHDLILPPDALQKLWDAGAPVAYGIYLFRGQGNAVNVYRMVKSSNLDMSLSYFQDDLKAAIEAHTPEVSGCGNGCTLIRREVLERIPFRKGDNGSFCPDMPFATDCLRAGIKQIGHFGVRCGHIVDDKIIYLKEGSDIPMAQCKILQTINAPDGKHYEAGDIAAIEDELAIELERAGYIAPIINHKLSIPVPSKSDPDLIPAGGRTIALRKHQGKADKIEAILTGAGYKVVGFNDLGANPDALLIDHDIEEYGVAPIIKKYAEQGLPIIMYPHGAAPILVWDGIYEPSPHITANLVTSKGNKTVMERYGYPHPIHVIGWYLTDIRPFKPTKGRKVLFAPNHPILGHQFMFEEERKINQQTYTRLLQLLKDKSISTLTVRHIGDLEHNGLWEEPSVEIIKASPDNSTNEIEAADIIIASGTFAWMSVALGKPTVMLTQLVNARQPDLETKKPKVAKNTDKYADYLRYPHDVERSSDLLKTIKYACNKEAKQWRQRFVGEQLNPKEFIQLVEGLIYGNN